MTKKCRRDDRNGEMCLPLGPRTRVSSVTVGFITNLEPDRGEPLDQFCADGIGDTHGAKVIMAAELSSDIPFPFMANVAQKAAKIVDDVVNVVAPRPRGSPVDRVADPGRGHSERRGGDEV